MNLVSAFFNHNKQEHSLPIHNKETSHFFIQHSYIDVILSIPEVYKTFGPIAAFVSSFSESFFPLLPLIGLIIANAATFGIVKGLFFSWFGSTLGTFCLYLIFRYYRNTSLLQLIAKNDVVYKLSKIFQRNEAFFLLVTFMLPFFPRFFITYLAGKNALNMKIFFLCTAIGNLILFSLLSIIGDNFYSIFKDPVKFIPVLLLFVVLSVVGKRLIKNI